jgi:hypothetical protein
MRKPRLLTTLLTLTLATSLITTPAATAEPLILPVGAAVTSTSGALTFNSGKGLASTIECESSSSTGEVTSPHLIGRIVAHFVGCKGKEGSGSECAIMSAGRPEGAVLTNTLHAILGLALLPHATTPAELLLPGKGGSFLTLLGTCIKETVLSGSIAGIVNPIGEHVLKGTLNFETPGGNQQVLHFLPSLGGLVLPELIFFGTQATLQLDNALEYSVPTEIT